MAKNDCCPVLTNLSFLLRLSYLLIFASFPISFSIFLCSQDKIRSKHTIPLAFTVTVMTFWKTVLYFLMFAEPCGDTSYRAGNSPLSEFFLVIIPNGVWLVLPLLVLVKLWAHITPKEHMEVKLRNE